MGKRLPWRSCKYVPFCIECSTVAWTKKLIGARLVLHGATSVRTAQIKCNNSAVTLNLHRYRAAIEFHLKLLVLV
jgi:hypothetical protein